MTQRNEPPTPFDATPAGMMQQMIRSGVTSENVAAFTELVKLSEHMEDRKIQRDAQAAFNASFVQVQKAIPAIKADKAVMKDGQVLYQYCSYEEIWNQVQPILSANGFSVRYSQEEKEGKVTTTCHLMHEGGVTVSNGYTVRSGKGAPGMNETKCDAAASTVSQREALCDALNIIRRARDDNANMEGGLITVQQAKELRDRVAATGSDPARFLAFALKGKPGDFEDIHADMFYSLDAMLKKRESTK